MNDLDIPRIIGALTSGNGRLIGGAVLLVVVWAAKRFTPDAVLATATSKRAFALAIAIIPAVALALLAQASTAELLATALTAFAVATGLHHVIDQDKKTTTVSTTRVEVGPGFSDLTTDLAKQTTQGTPAPALVAESLRSPLPPEPDR